MRKILGKFLWKILGKFPATPLPTSCPTSLSPTHFPQDFPQELGGGISAGDVGRGVGGGVGEGVPGPYPHLADSPLPHPLPQPILAENLAEKWVGERDVLQGYVGGDVGRGPWEGVSEKAVFPGQSMPCFNRSWGNSLRKILGKILAEESCGKWVGQRDVGARCGPPTPSGRGCPRPLPRSPGGQNLAETSLCQPIFHKILRKNFPKISRKNLPKMVEGTTSISDTPSHTPRH